MKILSILIAFCGAGIGLFVLLKPVLTIEIQKRFYATINWRIEPISMPKEILNTRIMGVFLFIFSVTAVIFILVTGVTQPINQ